MLWPLLVMLAAYAALFLTLHLAAMRAEIFRRRVRTSELFAAQPARAAPFPWGEGARGAGG
jgi:heme exporter protein C